MALDAAEHRNLVTRASVQTTLDRLGKRGRNGVGTLRRLLAAREPNRRSPESVEPMLIRCLRRNGWPEPGPQYEIRHCGVFVARVDAAYPQWRIAVEYQSDEHHSGRRASERDNDRRLQIIAAGWFPVEATLPDVRNGGTRLSAALRAVRAKAA
jgi:hypothetical protein